MKREQVLFCEGETCMEYTVEGSGPPVLVLHGGHSDCRERLGTEALTGRQVILPSRPGYGNTNVDIGRWMDETADWYEKLLDHLGIGVVDVVAMSAGGPSGIHFAARKPERVRSLTLQAAVVMPWLTREDPLYKGAQVMFRSRVERVTWGMIRFGSRTVPERLFQQMASSFSLLPWSELQHRVTPWEKNDVLQLLTRQRSRRGFLLDLHHTQKDHTKKLSTLTCPVLIQHSRLDGSVPFTHAEAAVRARPDARMQVIDGWGHLIWCGPAAAETAAGLWTFLDELDHERGM
ncbi:alpha/beta fold hydrolase [Alkalicoccus chagannorensis]|uniref:alpha/beta fold hydrolase n=1 Tax=Alkalicoccus chagannorensis TaxID=427072 RepID=UPI00040B05AF|nr:alpha/beta hydrolase [Alkalicoccus chagannorensis]